MHADIAETIVAVASATGAGARAILRLSGPLAWHVVARLMNLPARPERRTLTTGELQVEALTGGLPADVYFWPGPHSYTGQDVVEVHTLSSLPLVEQVVAACLAGGARAAQPGEFTLRAFLAGKLDLPRAEAVLGVIEARDRDELKQALVQLAGGLAQPLHGLRDDLLNLLADVEAGLDFSDEDLSFVDDSALLKRLAHALAHVTLVRKQLDQRASARRPFRAVLVGAPNVGKSSLFNALTGAATALVSAEPGTTRDYLRVDLPGDIELIDTAGLRETRSAIEADAQALGADQAQQADVLLWCQEAGNESTDVPPTWHGREVVRVATKCDRHPARSGALPTSAATGQGIDALRQRLTELAHTRPQAALAPSLSRCRHHVDACLRHLRSAHACALHHDPPEILAAELRGALDELGTMVGAIYTDDLLDRIFSRFCIGK